MKNKIARVAKVMKRTGGSDWATSHPPLFSHWLEQIQRDDPAVTVDELWLRTLEILKSSKAGER